MKGTSSQSKHGKKNTLPLSIKQTFIIENDKYLIERIPDRTSFLSLTRLEIDVVIHFRYPIVIILSIDESHPVQIFGSTSLNNV